MLTKALKGLSRCMLCHTGTVGEPLCPGCYQDLPRLGPFCSSCSLPLPAPGLCGQCGRSRPAFDRVIAVFPYRYPVDSMIQDLKYRSRLQWLRLFAGELAGRVLADGGALPDRLVPVPQHWLRRCGRGFNQALEIAREVGRNLGIPVNDRLLRRVRFSAAQTRLGAAERARNVRHSFRMEAPKCVGLRAAIVDDVVTTGATVEELARVLKRAGAADVAVWAIARAARP